MGWRLSPEETRVVFNSVVDGNIDVRIKHLPDGPEERITFSENEDHRPFWTPDGQSVTYFSGPPGEYDLWSRRADGTGEAVLVFDGELGLTQGSWSSDGEWLVFRVAATAALGLGRRDILGFRPGVDSAAVSLVASAEFAEQGPALSPNGRWIAYSSNETGRDEVFVRPFPNVDSTRVRISTDGGRAPLWAKSGDELFFVDEDDGLLATPFDPSSGRPQTPETLFTIPVGYPTNASNNFYDISSDGERFLMARPLGDDDGGTAVYIVTNWFEELRERAGN
jgi:Tol biopolymer transport system component